MQTVERAILDEARSNGLKLAAQNFQWNGGAELAQELNKLEIRFAGRRLRHSLSQEELSDCREAIQRDEVKRFVRDAVSALTATLTMSLTTTQLLDLLKEGPGRYIEHSMGEYTVKEATGTNVHVTERGIDFPISPAASQVEDLLEQSLLRRDGSRFWPL